MDLEELFCWIAIIIYIAVAIYNSIRKTGKKTNSQNYKDEKEARANALYQSNTKLNKNPKLTTKADVDYWEKTQKRKKKESANDRFAVMCPYCGAPLKVIYNRCEYCGMSYKEASDLMEAANEQDEE